jgi:hypothetical protein
MKMCIRDCFVICANRTSRMASATVVVHTWLKQIPKTPVVLSRAACRIDARFNRCLRPAEKRRHLTWC